MLFEMDCCKKTYTVYLTNPASTQSKGLMSDLNIE